MLKITTLQDFWQREDLHETGGRKLLWREITEVFCQRATVVLFSIRTQGGISQDK